MLKETVHIYRWSAVAVGFAGVVVMLWPYLRVGDSWRRGLPPAPSGRACAVTGTYTDAGATIQTRRLSDRRIDRLDRVLFFAHLHARGRRFAAVRMEPAESPRELAALIAIGVLGGLSHLFLTESYRHAPASLVAPFDYVALLWAFLFGYVLFGEIPTWYVYAGAVIVAAFGPVRDLARASGSGTPEAPLRHR